jgi:hypothetical protein
MWEMGGRDDRRSIRRSILKKIPILRVITIGRARTTALIVLLPDGEFHGSEPFIGEGGNKIIVIIVGLKATKGKKVGPRGRGFGGTRVNGIKRIVVNDMELRADVVGSKVANEPHSAGVERGCPHILTLSRPRLPLGYLSSILEPRSKDINRATPGMGVDEGAKGRLGAGPDFMRSKASGLTGDLVMERDGVTEGQGPEVPLIVLRPTKGRVNHHRASRANGVFDSRFGHAIVVVPADPAMPDALTLGGKCGGKFLGGVDAVVSAVGTDLNANTSSFTFKTKLGLNSLGAGETHLVDDGEFSTGRIAENGPATKLLGGKVVSTRRELAPEKRRLVLVREDKVARFELVQLENARGWGSNSGASARGALLFAELASCALGSLNGGGPHFYTKGAEKATASEPLSVLKPKMAPLGVPREEALLEGSEVGRSRFGDAVEGKRLGRREHVMEATDNGERCLLMVGNSDSVAVGQGKEGPVPFEDILTAMVFVEKDLGTEQADLQLRKVVPFTF